MHVVGVSPLQVPLAEVVNEMVSPSTKYAAPPGRHPGRYLHVNFGFSEWHTMLSELGT